MHSPSTQSEMGTAMGGSVHENDEIVSRLNAKVSNMKLNEEKLIQQLS